MKPLVFKETSWHYWLASDLAGYNAKQRWDANLCDYTKAVFKGCVVVALLAMLALGLLYWVGITLAWWVAIAVHGFIDAVAPQALTMVLIVGGASYVIVTGSTKISNYVKAKHMTKRRAKNIAAPDWFIPNAWRALKEKTCVRIKIEGTHEVDD